jgi:hypothetical protein
MLVRGACIESFYHAPMAYILSQQGNTRSAQPLFTITAAKEAVVSMEDALEARGLRGLLRPIRASVVFSLICDAIAKVVDPTSFIADKVMTESLSRAAMLNTNSLNGKIAKSIELIAKTDVKKGLAAYRVECSLDGKRQEFTVAVGRAYPSGRLYACVE